MKRKKKRNRKIDVIMQIALFALGMIILASCGTANDSISDGAVSEEMNQRDETSLSLTDIEPTNANDDTVCGYEDNPDCCNGSISDLFREIDSNYNESQEYINALAAYDEIFTAIYQTADGLDFKSNPHFYAAYINGNDIPELLVSYGYGHSCGICVYEYSDFGITYFGEFGSFGTFIYYERSSLIESYYGNHGCFTTYLTYLGEDGLVLKDAWIEDGSGIIQENTCYYHGFTSLESIDGTRESFENNGLSELYINVEELSETEPDGLDVYRISENDFINGKPLWRGLPDEQGITISYDDMYSLD